MMQEAWAHGISNWQVAFKCTFIIYLAAYVISTSYKYESAAKYFF